MVNEFSFCYFVHTAKRRRKKQQLRDKVVNATGSCPVVSLIASTNPFQHLTTFSFTLRFYREDCVSWLFGVSSLSFSFIFVYSLSVCTTTETVKMDGLDKPSLEPVSFLVFFPCIWPMVVI